MSSPAALPKRHAPKLSALTGFWTAAKNPIGRQPSCGQPARQGVDLVVDNVGQATWGSSLRTLRPGGRLLTVGGTSGYQAQVPVNLLFARHLRLIGSTMGAQSDYTTVMNLVFQGRLQPVVDSVFELQQFRSAMARMLADEMFGKILMKVGER